MLFFQGSYNFVKTSQKKTMEKKLSLLFLLASSYLSCLLLFPLHTPLQASPLFNIHQNPKIFKVQKSISLSEKQTPPTDYYVNAGTNMGLQPGWIVKVYRELEFHLPDRRGSSAFQKAWIPIGEALIIFSSKEISVARVHQIYPSKHHPHFLLKTLLPEDKIDLRSLQPFINTKDMVPNIQVKEVDFESNLLSLKNKGEKP